MGDNGKRFGSKRSELSVVGCRFGCQKLKSKSTEGTTRSTQSTTDDTTTVGCTNKGTSRNYVIQKQALVTVRYRLHDL